MCANWGILADKFNKRLSNWKAMSLSFGGRVTLIKSVLGSLGQNLKIGMERRARLRSSLELCELLELCSLVAHLRLSDNGDS
ncbi:hypothetical protein Tco_1031037 [Tanacetum coccineum]|uniref:Uncharacterized protein n=1 Tax=Tanacetum coccineum TaxID=301880 RepID=A0ABQ5G871_9ASTR